MTTILLRWVASAAALYIVTKIVPGVSVSGVMAALIAALAIGLVNATLGNLLKLLTLPIGCLTLGISGLVINALMFMLAAYAIDGFAVSGFLAALGGSIAMTVVNWVLDMIVSGLMSGDDKKK